MPLDDTCRLSGAARAAARSLACLAITTAVCNAAEPRSEPVVEATQVVERLHEALAGIAGSTDQSLDFRYRKIRSAVSATHDFGDMAQFLLRREWGELSESQRRQFEERFTELSATQYASRFVRLERDAMKVVGAEVAGPERVYVHASLTPADGEDVILAYTLERKSDGWQIVNVVADGVSDLALRRAEYSRVIRNGGFEALMEHLDEQIAALD